MRNSRRKGILIVSVIFLFLINPVSAQGESGNQTDNTAVFAFDDTTTLMNVSWSNTGVCMTFRSDMPRLAAITDINSIPDSGAGEVNYKRIKLANGDTRVCMNLESDRGDMSATISVGESVAAVSNPAEPLFDNITRTHFYVGLLFAPITMGLQVLGRRKWRRYMLKKSLTRVA